MLKNTIQIKITKNFQLYIFLHNLYSDYIYLIIKVNILYEYTVVYKLQLHCAYTRRVRVLTTGKSSHIVHCYILEMLKPVNCSARTGP